MTNATQKVQFISDECVLEGILRSPKTRGKIPGDVICHPHPQYGGDMQNSVVRILAELLAVSGISILMF